MDRSNEWNTRKRTVTGSLEGYERAEMHLKYSAPEGKIAQQTASGSALRCVSLMFGVGQAAFVSDGSIILAFGDARQMVGLIEMLGFQELGGYRLALNAFYDARFSGPTFVPEVEMATIMLPDLRTDPRYGRPGWKRFAYGALLLDRYGPCGTGTVAEVLDVGEFTLSLDTGLPLAV